MGIPSISSIFGIVRSRSSHRGTLKLFSIYPIQTVKTDISLRYRTFSQKINKMPTFSEVTELWQYLKTCVYMVR